MSQVNIQEVEKEIEKRLNEIHSLIAHLKNVIERCKKCEDFLRACREAYDELENILTKILKGEIHDLHIELSTTKLLELRYEAECLPDHYYEIEKPVDIICVKDTPLGKLLIYTIYDAVLNPSEETIREIVKEKVKPELQEQAIQELKELLGK